MSPRAGGGASGLPDRVVLAGAVAAQLVVLYWPRAAGGGAPHLDKLVHLAVFGAVAWAGVRASVPVRLLAGLLLAHAVVSELVQASLLPGRSGDAADVVADVAGVALGLVAAKAHRGRVRRGRASWRHDDRAARAGHHAGRADAGGDPRAG